MGKIVLGILGILQPTTSALLHNTSALLIGLHSMKDVSQIIMYEKKNKNYVKCLTWFLFFIPSMLHFPLSGIHGMKLHQMIVCYHK